MSCVFCIAKVVNLTPIPCVVGLFHNFFDHAYQVLIVVEEITDIPVLPEHGFKDRYSAANHWFSPGNGIQQHPTGGQCVGPRFMRKDNKVKRRHTILRRLPCSSAYLGVSRQEHSCSSQYFSSACVRWHGIPHVSVSVGGPISQLLRTQETLWLYRLALKIQSGSAQPTRLRGVRLEREKSGAQGHQLCPIATDNYSPGYRV